MSQNDLFDQLPSGSWAEGVNDVELNRFVNALGGRLGRDSVVSISRTKDPLPENAFQTTNLLGMQKKRLSARFFDGKKGSPGGSFSNRRDGDVEKLISSNAKIVEHINWKPQHNDLKEIINSSVRWEEKINASNT